MKKFILHKFATQVQPQNGQLLVEHTNILLRECTQKVYHLNPQAASQAVAGQILYEDEGGYLYLAH